MAKRLPQWLAEQQLLKHVSKRSWENENSTKFGSWKIKSVELVHKYEKGSHLVIRLYKNLFLIQWIKILCLISDIIVKF